MKCTLLIVSIIVLSYGCQKTISDTSLPGVTTDSSYLPLTPNSYWKYKDSAFTGQVTTETVLGAQVTINGKKYDKIKLDVGSSVDTAYFSKTGAEYFTYSHTIISGALLDLEILFLNDTASIGYQWTANAGTVNGFPAQCIGKIIERNISFAVSGKTYANVIHSQIQLQYNLLGSFETFAVYDYYVAKGVGIIKISSELEFFGTSLKTATNLFEYAIY